MKKAKVAGSNKRVRKKRRRLDDGEKLYRRRRACSPKEREGTLGVRRRCGEWRSRRKGIQLSSRPCRQERQVSGALEMVNAS
jgi:hypothetical protein